MREGFNPSKAEVLPAFKRHRVIVPVYVPSSDGYFRHAAEILKLCLDSLVLTTNGRASITVVSNGCAPSIVKLLRSYFESGRISQLVINHRNWGKIDAALSLLRGRFEEMLTVADADVLFQPGWLEAVQQLFHDFPECGFATPSPNPSLAYLHTSSTIFGAMTAGELHFEGVVPELDLDQFARSIGRPGFLPPEQKRVQMIVRRRGRTAVVGGGHFVFTMRREVAWQLPSTPSNVALRPLGETLWFDDPPDALGAWRLSTARAYAYHMGNVPEPWMHEALARCGVENDTTMPDADRPLPAFTPSWWRHVPLAWRQRGLNATRRLHIERKWAREAMVESAHA